MIKRLVKTVSVLLVCLLLIPQLPILPGVFGGNGGVVYAESAAGPTNGVYVRLKNSYTGAYLFERDGKVQYGHPEETDFTSQWLVEDHGTYQRLQNRATGHYMTMEHVVSFGDPLESLDVADDDLFAEWHVLDAVTPGLKVIQSATNPELYIHVQDNTGYAQSSKIPPDWGTPQWAFEPVADYVQIKNSYTGKYLFEQDGKVLYGDPDPADPASHWLIESFDGNERIKNRATGHYMTMEHVVSFGDPLESLDVADDDLFAEWHVLDAVTPGLKVIQSVTNPEIYIHVQDNTGYAQSSKIPPEWGTPQWQLLVVNVDYPFNEGGKDDGPAYIRIKNDYLGLYMYEDDGIVRYGNVRADDQTGHWLIENEDGVQRIKNRATGHYLSIADVASDKVAVKAVDAPESAQTEQWIIDNLDTAGVKLIRNVAYDDQYLHVEKQLGFVQFGVIPPEWGSPKWDFIEVNDAAIPHYVRLKNQFTGQYLYADDGKVMYGNPDLNDARSHWLIADFNGNKRIQNRANGCFMTNEHVTSYMDPLECIPVEDSWASAQWTMRDAATPGDVVFANVWHPEQVIHVEDQLSFAQSSSIPENWGSAQWTKEDAPADLPVTIPDGFVHIVNAQSGALLYENAHGIVQYGNPAASDPNAQWKVVPNGAYITLQNRGTNHFMSLRNHEAFVESLAISDIQDTEQWQLESAPASGKVLFRSVSQPEQYLHISSGAGFAEVGLRSIESAAVQWTFEPAADEIVLPEPGAGGTQMDTAVFAEANPVRLHSRVNGSLLYETNGTAAVGNPVDPAAAEWVIQHKNAHVQLINPSSGEPLTVSGQNEWALRQQGDWIALFSVSQPDAQVYADGATLRLGTPNEANAGQWLREVMSGTAVYEAEEAFISGGAVVATDQKGFTGDGYVDNLTAANARVIFAVNAQSAGAYRIHLRYANGSGLTAGLKLRVNGLNEQQLWLDSTGGWDAWGLAQADVTLRKGINTITLDHASGISEHVSVDSLTVDNGVYPEYRGATLPYTVYEAEQMANTGTILAPTREYKQIAAEASGRQAVRLDETGQYVEFTLSRNANALTVRYALPDSADGTGMDATLGVYVNGKRVQSANLTSHYAWVYGAYPWSNNPADGDAHRFFDETRIWLGDLPAGTVIRLQKDADDPADYYVIDKVEAEQADEAYTAPTGSISIADFGAVAGDGKDDTDALVAAVSRAEKTGEIVWIPAGVFDLKQGPVELRGVTVRGAGVWHTTVQGAGFLAKGGAIGLYDFTIDGEVTGRHDALPESGVDGVFGPGSIIQNMWIEHVKAGIWSAEQNDSALGKLDTDGLYVVGCRIRNTFADGINFDAGTMHSMVEQTQLQNTGDDALAMWSDGVATVGNTFRFNTVQLPWLANNVAIYGGNGNRVTDNVIADTIAFGAGITVSTRFNPAPFAGTTVVKRNTLVRAGGREYNWNADFGGILIFAGDIDLTGDVQIADNDILDSSKQGISFLGEKSTSGVVFSRDLVDGTGTWGINASGNIKGTAVFDHVIVRNVRVGELFNGTGGRMMLLPQNQGFNFDRQGLQLILGSVTDGPFTLMAGDHAASVVTAVYNGAPVNVTPLVQWQVGDPLIAEIADNGIVQAVSPGNTVITAVYGDTSATWTLQVTDHQAPYWQAGAQLQANVQGNTVQVSWPTALDNGGVARYRLNWGASYAVVPGDITSYTIHNLSFGSPYSLVLEAIDHAGNWSELPLTAEVRIPANSGGIAETPGSNGEGAINVQNSPQGVVIELPPQEMPDANAGQALTAYSLPGDVLEQAVAQLEKSGKNQIVLRAPSNSAAVEVAIPATAFAAAAKQAEGGSVVVQSANASYMLPFTAASWFTASADDQWVVQISPVDAAAQSALRKTGNNLLAPAVEFRLGLRNSNHTRWLDDLHGHYITRTLILNRQVDENTAAAVRYDPSAGRFSYVPAVFRTVDGKPAAIIRSPGNSVYTVVDNETAFSDIDKHWAESRIRWLANHFIISGYADGKFAPKANVTRAEFAGMLVRALGLSGRSYGESFKDVHAGDWFASDLGAAKAVGLISGYADGTFRPNQPITREESVVLLLRAFHLLAAQAEDVPGVDLNVLNSFRDDGQVAAWAREDLARAVQIGLIHGDSGRLLPQQSTTRAEAAVMIYGVIQQTSSADLFR
ncbi:MAG TPA: S-layer homology domain-containing protein [Bacilli bacterium]